MTLLGAGTASAGICDEIITLFRATGLNKTGPGDGDGSEQITLLEVPLAGGGEVVGRQGQRRLPDRSEGLRRAVFRESGSLNRP